MIIGKRNIKSMTSLGVFITESSLVRNLFYIQVELSLRRGNSFREVEQNSFSFKVVVHILNDKFINNSLLII